MHNSFWFDYKINDLLFNGLDIKSVTGIIVTCIVCILAAATFECLKLCQIRVKLKSILLRSPINFNLPCFNDESELLHENSVSTRHSTEICWVLTEVSMYALQAFLGYILMLLVMTFNGYLSLAVLCGAGAGYALFGAQCAESRLKMTRLKIPCQECTQFQRSASAASTLLENDSLATNLGDQSASSMASPENKNETNIDVHTVNTLPVTAPTTSSS